jgi:hypothetical protein
MNHRLDEKLKKAIENDNFNFEKYLGEGKKWYQYYLIVSELVWARNFHDGYIIEVYDDLENKNHFGTFLIDYIPAVSGYHLVPRIQRKI